MRRWIRRLTITTAALALLGGGGFVVGFTLLNGHTPWTRSQGAVDLVLAGAQQQAIRPLELPVVAPDGTLALTNSDKQPKATQPLGAPTPVAHAAPPTPTPRPDDQSAVQQGTVQSHILAASLPFQIYLPAGYDDPAYAQARYPTVYLLHGDPGNYTDWINNTGLDKTADAMISTGQLPPAIIVMPFDGSYGSTEWANGAKGKAQGEDYVVKELIPFIDAHYRTIADPRYRAVGGLSTGGYAGLNLTFHHPELFRIAFGMSGNYVEEPPYLGRDLWGNDAKAKADNSPLSYAAQLKQPEALHVHLDVGANDSLDDALHQTQQMEQALVAAKIPHEVFYYPGAHTWQFWTAHLVDCLRFVTHSLPGMNDSHG